MDNKLEEFLRLPYSIEVIPSQTTEGSICYLASHPELTGCMSHGDTPEQAISNLLEAKKLYISTLLRKGESVPLPESSLMVIWEISEVKPVTPAESAVFKGKIAKSMQ